MPGSVAAITTQYPAQLIWIPSDQLSASPLESFCSHLVGIHAPWRFIMSIPALPSLLVNATIVDLRGSAVVWKWFIWSKEFGHAECLYRTNIGDTEEHYDDNQIIKTANDRPKHNSFILCRRPSSYIRKAATMSNFSHWIINYFFYNVHLLGIWSALLHIGFFSVSTQLALCVLQNGIAYCGSLPIGTYLVFLPDWAQLK